MPQIYFILFSMSYDLSGNSVKKIAATSAAKKITQNTIFSKKRPT
jgi:hypothetical protein